MRKARPYFMRAWRPTAFAVTALAVASVAHAAPTAPTTVEAENMTTKTVGGGYNGVWNLWSNGSVSNDVTFPSSGTYTLTISAQGQLAAGVGPDMRLRIDGQEVAKFSVSSTSMTTYSARVNVASGTRKVEIAFMNDAQVNGQDRNLILDKIAISAPTGTPSPTPAPTVPSGVPTTPATVEAESMQTRTVGGQTGAYWMIWSNGYVENQVNFASSGSFDVKVVAQGQLAGGVGPNMEVRLDGTRVAGQDNLSATAQTYTFKVNATAGIHKVAIAFTNDAQVNGQDRNLLVDKVIVSASSGTATPAPTPIATPVPAPVPPTAGTPTPVNGIAMPFGSHPMSYAAGTIKPQVAQSTMDQAVKASYDLWKSRYVVQRCGPDRYVVVGGQPGKLAVSEGQGYGMLIVALMAGYDPNARKIFDGIHRFSRDKMSPYYPNMMSWVINDDANCSDGGQYPAVDGDLDMALGLLMAHRQWGSNGSINYLEEAKKTIDAIKTKIVKNNFIAGGPVADAARTSDFMFAHFRAFKKYTNDATWDAVLNKTQSLIEYMQANYAANTGLTPDFIENANTSTPKVITISRWPESDLVDKYAYNACRNPWRFGTDVIVSGDARSKAITQKMMNFFRTNSGGQASGIKAGYQLNGTVFGNYTNMSFQAPVGVGAMVGSENQAFLNNMWSFMASNTAGGYYDHSIQLISMMVMSGNWWQP